VKSLWTCFPPTDLFIFGFVFLVFWVWGKLKSGVRKISRNRVEESECVVSRSINFFGSSEEQKSEYDGEFSMGSGIER